jgi:copper chaperone CopZ
MTLALATSEVVNAWPPAIAPHIGSTSVKHKETVYEILHETVGRIRLGIPRLANDEEYANQLTHVLNSLSFVTNVRINLAAKCVAIDYEGNETSETQIQQLILAAVRGADQVVLLPTAIFEELEKEIISFWDWCANALKNVMGVASLAVGIVLVPVPIVPGWPLILFGIYCLTGEQKEN